MLGYALIFLTLALAAGVIGLTGITGAAATVAWGVLVALFVLTLAAAVGRALVRITLFER